MRIAQLASSVEPVPPAGYGGTELVVSNITEELVSRGHEVTLFASGDSSTAAKLVSVTTTALRPSGEPSRRWAAYDIRTLCELKRMWDQFDIVHNHMGWQALPALAELGIPTVTTNHNLIKPYCAPIYLEYRDLPFVSISDAYRRLNYPDKLNYVATVYNGIDADRFSGTNHRKRDYLLFMGRLCADKGTEKAIEIAKQLKLPLILAGKVDPADQAYYEQHVKPHLDDSCVRYIGEVNHEQKAKLYQRAIATVYTIDFEEPFGLVMVESLASGTPVMALSRGAVSEVLSDRETAVVGQSVEELVNRFAEVKEIDSELCRHRVESLFSKQKMVDAYEKLYCLLAGGQA
jgi:glycosyltransferase involved in cell wall biosynthesis